MLSSRTWSIGLLDADETIRLDARYSLDENIGNLGLKSPTKKSQTGIYKIESVASVNPDITTVCIIWVDYYYYYYYFDFWLVK